MPGTFVLVAQWIERSPPKRQVARPIRAEDNSCHLSLTVLKIVVNPLGDSTGNLLSVVNRGKEKRLSRVRDKSTLYKNSRHRRLSNDIEIPRLDSTGAYWKISTEMAENL